MTIRPRRQALNPDQIPLIVPESDWTAPTQLPDLSKIGVIALDTETKDDGLSDGRGPGWVYGAGYVCGVGVAWRDGADIRRIYVPIAHPDTQCFPKDQVAAWLTDITRGNRVVFQNAPYDLGWLSTDLGVALPPVIDDVGCQAVMIDESHRPTGGFPKPYSLDAMAARLVVSMKDEALLREAAQVYGIKPSEAKANLWRMPARFVGPYGQQDPATTLEVWEKQCPMIAEQALDEAYRLEMDLIPMVHAMRSRGIRLDLPRAYEAADMLERRRDKALAELRRRIGGPEITMNEIRQHKWIVSTFSNEGVEVAEKEGKASFEKDWMRQGYVGRYEPGRQGHWLPQLIAEVKQCHDAADKFIRGYLIDYAHRGRVHASINQFKSEDGGTRTHRFSYSDPPLQQMPSRPEKFLEEWTLTAEIASDIRSLFLPEAGEKWFSPDYSQQEYRLIVHYAAELGCDKADAAVEKYASDPNTDFHILVVEMTGLSRRHAKDVNFAKAYGAGVGRFSDMTGMSEDEAKETMGQYDTEMPFVKQLMARCTKAAERRGYIVMLDKARMHFNYWEPAYLPYADRQRGWNQGWEMGECNIDEARRRVKGEAKRPHGAPPTDEHPWLRRPLKRAFAHKAGNALIQGGAARQGKRAMRDMWREGYVPLMQMHDEFPVSVAREKDGKRIADIMRSAVPLHVPMRVDEEYGCNWGDAKHPWAKAKFAK